MVLALYKSVVSGELKPKREQKGKQLARESMYPIPGEAPSERHAYLTYLAELLQAFPATRAAIETEAASANRHICPERIDEPEPYIRSRLPVPFNRETGFYHTLIRYEAKRFLSEFWGETIHPDNTDEDRRQQYHMAQEALVDLLREVRRLLKSYESEKSSGPEHTGIWILQLLKLTLTELLLELSERSASVGGVKRYTEQILFTGVLDEPVPDEPLFEKSPACLHAAAIRCINNRTDLKRLAELLTEIRSKLCNLTGTTTSPHSGRDMIELCNLLAHLENAYLLITLKPSFIKRERRRLTDPDFCREWVAGIRHEFVIEEDHRRAGALLRDLREAARKLIPVYRGVVQLPDTIIRSEAVRLTEYVWQLETDPPGQNRHGLPSGNHAANYSVPYSDFVQSVRRRFVFKQELLEAFGISERTLEEYLKDMDIRWVELSSNVRLYYREDVEAFLRDRTR